MSRCVWFPTLLPVFLLIGACGSSSQSATKSRLTTSAAAPTTPGGQAAFRTAGQSSTKPTPSPATTTAATAANGGSGAAASPSGSGSTNARVPATFAIRPGGKLAPATVSSPAFLAVQLTVTSGDGKAHRVRIHTPVVYSLRVPAHATATVYLRGLRAGRYDIVVDGATRGALLIGGEPGP